MELNGQVSHERHDPTFGRAVPRHFTTPGQNPFQIFSWNIQECVIASEAGGKVFTQGGVEAPTSWSSMAVTVVASKYFHGEQGSSAREHSIRQLVDRVVATIATWGKGLGYFDSSDALDAFESELAYSIIDQRASFNSPVWFNVGIHKEPQTSACFIISVDDTLDSLSSLQALESRLFKYGSGIGTNFSTLRSHSEGLSGGGIASGPVSFIRALDGWAGIVKSGGKTRRAAKMAILNVDHPDILDFITCKAAEERKAHALIDSGYDGGFAAKGGAYDSVAFQNANLSVRVTDEFMKACEADATYSTRYVTSGREAETLSARAVMKKISEATWLCGDPGLQFDSTINAWHTCPNSGRINGSNPCSEYMSVDNSACNLASINLLKFLRSDNSFDIEAFRHVVDLFITAQDVLIDRSSYPSQKIAANARSFRQLGLGFTNLGALLMCLGLPYDSEGGRAYAGALASIMTGQAYLTSSHLAQVLGACEAFQRNKQPFLEVIRKHRNASRNLPEDLLPPELYQQATDIWDSVFYDGENFGFRNAQVTVLAPTGTISFMMDCDTTGIEPEIGLVKYKKLSDGGMLKLVNASVPRALSTLGYRSPALKEISDYIATHGTIEGAPHLRPDHLEVFDCALALNGAKRSINYMGHLKMMAAVQPFISGAISKTVNVPADTSADEIMEIYVRAWKLGIKAVALYRDGSKRTQPLNGKKQEITTEVSPAAVRRRLPAERPALTHRFRIGSLKGYLTVGLFEDGAPGEIFLVVAKEGSTLSGITDAFATAVSLALQYGVPLSSLVKKFAHCRFEPAGFTDSKDIPMASSIVDYVFRYLALRFLSHEERQALGLLTTKQDSAAKMRDEYNASQFEDAPPCTSCGAAMMVRQGNCYLCLNCGSQGGCS